MPSISVLMSTYRSEKAENLAASLESVYAQTLPPDQVVLVVDGPVPEEQNEVIRRFQDDWRVAAMTVVRLPENLGLAGALNAGLTVCLGEYVARMDSDDICLPDRLRLQHDYAVSHPDVDVVSSWSEEFFPEGRRGQIKVSPVGHEHVTEALRWRNVLVHPTIFIRTRALRDVGGYSRRFGMLEDYDLFVRLCIAGYRFHVLPKTLVRVRSSLEQRGRRGGLRYTMNEVAFRIECWRRGFLATHHLVVTTGMYVVFRLASGPMRKRIYALARA